MYCVFLVKQTNVYMAILVYHCSSSVLSPVTVCCQLIENLRIFIHVTLLFPTVLI